MLVSCREVLMLDDDLCNCSQVMRTIPLLRQCLPPFHQEVLQQVTTVRVTLAHGLVMLELQLVITPRDMISTRCTIMHRCMNSTTAASSRYSVLLYFLYSIVLPVTLSLMCRDSLSLGETRLAGFIGAK